MMGATMLVMVLMLGEGGGRAAVAAQQPPPAPGAAAPDADAQGVSASEIQRLYDAYALVQAQDALQLSDEHYVRFVARLKALQETRRRHFVARNRILQELRRLTGGSTAADDGAVRDRLKALRDEEDKSAAELRQAQDAVDALLDVRQQAKFRLFEEQMDRKRLDLLMRARQNVRGRKGG